MSTQQTSASAGVSLSAMQAQLAQMAAELAETKAAAAAKPQLRTVQSAPAKPAHVPVYKVSQHTPHLANRPSAS